MMQDLSFLDDLNDAQRSAVEYVDGPSLVIAGAGSGKTRVLTYKIAYLLATGMQPWEVMALTFTNKAAREMKERIANIVGTDAARYLRMGTFHSLFSRILRTEAHAIGFTSSYTIYDDSDSKSLVKSVIKDLALNDKVYKPAEVYNRISAAKNRLMTAEMYADDPYVTTRDREDKMPDMGNIYKVYQTRCKASNAMDFDDLLLNTYNLFNEHKDILEKYANGLRFILVDEYQDTNYAQQCIIEQLTSLHQKICVVGDDAQSIYSFRGADIDNILNFQKVYEGARLFKLEQNYRSTQNIVQAANSLIHKNQWQIEKNVFSRNDEGDRLVLRILASDREEAAFVGNEINVKVHHDGAQYSDFAILYRTNSQSRAFEEQFMKSGIPYRIYGGLSFYQRKEIKDVTAYLRLVVNNNDDEAFRRAIKYPSKGIGDTTLQKIAAAAHENGVSMWQIINDPMAASLLKVNRGTAGKLLAFTGMINNFSVKQNTEDAATIVTDIVKLSGISQDIYSGNEPEDKARQENLEEFISSVRQFVENAREEDLPGSLADFLNDIALLSDRGEDDVDKPQVTLMTVHSAKGLEFPQVYVVGLEENIFPSQMCLESPHALEEERRLLYVAITRAEQKCTLTCARSRYRYGHMEFGTPSRFLHEIDSRFLDSKDGELRARNRMTQRQNFFGALPEYARQGQSSQYSKSKTVSPAGRTAAPSRPMPLASAGKALSPLSAAPSSAHRTSAGREGYPNVGSHVMHDRFGKGVVLDVHGSGDSTKATVEFENVGTKQLLLKFARLQVL